MQRPQLSEGEQAKGAWVWEPVSYRALRSGGAGSGRPRRSRAASNATSRLLAAASLAQLCALAVGGAWVLARLRALEASHERLLREATCVSSSGSAVAASESADETPEASRVGLLRSNGDRGEEARTSQGRPRIGGNQITEHKRGERSLQRRSIGRRTRPLSPNGSRPTLPAFSDQQMFSECRGRIAHFEFSNASINPNDFRHDVQRSAAENAFVMTSLAGSDRWYPLMLQYEVGGQLGLQAIKYMSLPHSLRHGNCSENGLATFMDGQIEVKKEGIYLIYAQIGFVGTSSFVGFTIKKRRAHSVVEHSIASCELHMATGGRRQPATCSVTTVHRLNGGDSLSIVPIGAVRVMLREDYSFAGLAQLA